MKIIVKELSLFIVIVLSLIFIYPQSVDALSQQTPYVSIHDHTQTLTVDQLSFSDITFKDYSSTSTQALGLSGVVVNHSDKTINYVSTVYYYDSDYHLIAQGYQSKNAIKGTSDFNQMSNLNILNGHSIDEIYYYRLSIDYTNTISDNETVSSNIPSKNSEYSFYDYVIDQYDVNIVVNENNTFDITETITAYFNVPKHGIIRTIPLKNTLIRLDGTKSTNRTQVSNVSVDNNYTTSRQNGNYKLQIGSKDSTLTGEQTYVIQYTYHLGEDPIKDYDELYYNIIGNEWDTVIGNITFTIVMPKEFDSSKLGFSSGGIGSTDNSNINYNVDGNTIFGSYNGILDVGDALTVRCELDEGYFVNAALPISIGKYIMLVIPIIFLGIAILLWYRFGRDDQVIETVEFYPPEGFNSLEIGFLYKGKADNQDVTSLLIYLANKGYIKIVETGKSKSDEFKIVKLKEYDGDNLNEKIFLNGLFSKEQSTTSSSSQISETTNHMAEVTSSDLYDNFYITMSEILSNVNSRKNKNKIFEKTASSKSIFIILMILATYCLITIPPIITYGEVDSLIFALLFPGIGFTVMFSMLFGGKETIYFNGRAIQSFVATKIFGIVWGLLFGGMPWLGLVLPSLLQEPIYLIQYIIGIVCVLGMVICLKILPKRTQYGNEMLGKLRGFRRFLETAEKEKLETMVMQNPVYFYDILPYTYVLGVSDTWIKKFEMLSLQAPTWYDSPNTFSVSNFGIFMNNTMVSAQRVMSSSPSSVSSGSSIGSSGGGFSGGGSGGGGGSSW